MIKLRLSVNHRDLSRRQIDKIEHEILDSLNPVLTYTHTLWSYLNLYIHVYQATVVCKR